MYVYMYNFLITASLTAHLSTFSASILETLFLMLATFETFSVPSENRKWSQYLNTSENFVQVFWTNHMNIVTLLICLKNLWWLKRMKQCSQIQCSWGQKRDRLMKPKAGGMLPPLCPQSTATASCSDKCILWVQSPVMWWVLPKLQHWQAPLPAD